MRATQPSSTFSIEVPSSRGSDALEARRSHLIVVDLRRASCRPSARPSASRACGDPAPRRRTSRYSGHGHRAVSERSRPDRRLGRGRLADRHVIVPKLGFAATSDEAFGARVTTLRGEGRDQAVICGAEAHVCVLQTALGLKAQGFEVFVPGDAVSSRSPQRGCRSGTAPPGGLQVGDDGDGRVRMA